MTKTIALVVALACVVVIGALVWGASQSDDRSAVGELPTVAEVVAAQAHMHGIELPEIDDVDRERLAAQPTTASTLTPYAQVLAQLTAVKDVAGVDEALDILSEVARTNETVAASCTDLYDALTHRSTASRSVKEVCFK
jgi:hypothetical protein